MFESLVATLKDLWTLHPVGQSFGLLASLLVLISALQRSDRSLQGVMLLATIAWIIHYSLLGSLVAAISYVVGAVRNGIVYFGYVTPPRKLLITTAIILAYVVVGIFTINMTIEVIPVFCSSLYAVALINFTGIRMRLLMMLAQSLWFAYAASIGSIGGCLTVILEFSLTSVTIARLAMGYKSDRENISTA